MASTLQVELRQFNNKLVECCVDEVGPSFCFARRRQNSVFDVLCWVVIAPRLFAPEGCLDSFLLYLFQ